jgi:hypothetical protein
MATIHKPFKYVPALHTDVSQTIRRERLRLRAIEEAKRKATAEMLAKVTQLPRSKPQST